MTPGSSAVVEAAAPAASSEAVSASRLRPRVLVVDDDSRNLLALSEVLEDIGEIVCASSGTEALRHLLKDQFAVILMDVLMPGLDGYETAKLVRMREQSKDTPIIFLTAINKEDAHLLRGYDSGAVDFVFKPFEPTILRSKVAVFVSLYEKTREIERKALREQLLLQQSLEAQADKLEAERALRRSEERQEVILRSLPICFHSRTVTWPFGATYVNSAFTRITGFPTESLTENPDFGLARIHPDDREMVERTLSRALETGAYSCEFRWQCADDTYRTFLDQGVISRDLNGEPTEIVGTLLDITERRQLENQLLQAQKLDAIGKLTGGIAHDFNNLLASVLSGVALLEKRGEVNDRGKAILGMMQHAAQQGSHLVNRMLTFSRKQNLQPEVVALADVAGALDGMLAPVLGGLVRLVWALEDRLWPAYVDPSQLELAVMNLVLNARDAMPSGGTVTISVSNRVNAKRTDDLPAGEFVVVSVADNGTGIPKDLMSKVLDPFFTTKEAGKGTGLGLSTVFGFAQQSGGTLRILSEVGLGTTVEVWLPRSTEDVTLPDEATEAAHDAPQNGAHEVKTVLLVDDTPELRDLTRMHLVDAGYEVVCAAGGAEALALIEQQPARYDVILTDYAMPLMSGLDVIRFARSLRAGWPAIIITGYADQEQMKARPDDVALVAKPFAQETLIQALRSALRNQAAVSSGNIS